MLPRPDPVLGGCLVLYFFNKLLLLAVYGVALGSYAMPLQLSADVIYWVRIVEEIEHEAASEKDQVAAAYSANARSTCFKHRV
jgi:hypothetical protein